MKKMMTYDEAMCRLQEIVNLLETSEALSMDEYKERAKEAKQLIDFCKKQLSSMETEMKEFLQK